MRTLLTRIRSHFSDRTQADRLDEEISAHIDALAADYQARGMSPRDALLAARREFGAVTQMREEHREHRRLAFADALAQDVRYAFRQMAAHKAFTAAAILTLALGIGANTAIFEGLTAFVYRPMPVASPDQLAQIKIFNTSQPTASSTVNPSFSYPLYRDFVSRQTVASGIYASGWLQLANADLRISGSTQKARGVLVTGSFFPVLGVRAKIGRALAPSDDSPSAPLAVVLSDTFWDRAFARSSGAIGQSIEIARIPATIVGVAPASFKGEILMYEPDFYVPMSATPRVSSAHLLHDRSMSWLSVMARLKPGVSLAAAQSSLEALYRGLPDKESEIHVRVESGARGIPFAQAQMEQPGLLVMAVAALALLIACCNLATLLLGRAWSRTHEIGVRLAIGAGRARLVRQLFTESLVLALAGGTVAMLVYPWLLRWFSSFAELTIEAPMSGALLTTAICALLCTCVFGLAPALAATRLDFHAALQASRRAQSLVPARNRLGQALVVVQLSVSLLLISGSGLLLRSLWNVSHQDPGFRADHIAVADIPWDPTNPVPPHDAAIEQNLLDRLSALPGVQSAALSTAGPLSSNTWTGPLSSATRTSKQAGGQARLAAVTGRYFETLGVRILHGRSINSGDRANTRKIIVLSQTAAARIFGDVNPVGRFVSPNDVFENNDAMEVVGVAQDARYTDLKEPFGTVAYVPFAQQTDIPIGAILIRSTGDPAALSAAIRTAVSEVFPNRQISEIARLSDKVSGNMDEDRTLTFLIGCFSAIALGLACAGVFGVVAYGASRRTQEIGIRIALGAHRSEIARMLVRETSSLFIVSCAIGVVVTLAAMRLMSSLLFGIAPWDPSTGLAACAVLIVVAGIAAWLPAHRAARLDPVVALRQE